jgi:lipopolysaccharide transport system ATP-binding protein
VSRRPRVRSADNAVEFDHVSRKFTIHHERRESFQDWFVHRFLPDRASVEKFWALKDVSFDIKRGETVGLIGRNGAGKSTMLKLVTGILEPTSGAVRVSGRTYAMLELGAGFHPELSGRDNIFLNGSIYGFSRKIMRRKFDEIVAFAELDQFIDTPVKYYSSGMFMRLGFATAISMDPEILVIDEVLSVGDAAFQRRCNDAIRTLQDKGVTILLVSHSSEQVRDFCHRAILLSGGGVLADGEVEDVLTSYAQLQMRENNERNLQIAEELLGEKHVQAQFASVVLRDGNGNATPHIDPGAPLTIECTAIGDSSSPLDVILRWRTGLGLLLFETRHPMPVALDGGARSAACHIPALPLHSDGAVIEAHLCDPAGSVIIDSSEVQLHIAAPHGPLLRVAHTWSDATAAQRNGAGTKEAALVAAASDGRGTAP